MSWYSDPQLFMYYSDYYKKFRVLRIKTGYSITPFQKDGFYSELEDLNFTKHLSLGSNKESDYDAFKASLPRTEEGDFKYINCQGLVVHWIEKLKLGIWSREELESIFYTLPGLPLTGSGAKLLAEKRALEEKVSATEAKISTLEHEVSRTKDENQLQVQTISDLQAEKQSLDKTVSDLQAENSNLRDELEKERDTKSGLINDDEEPWKGGDTVPSNLVPFEDLDVLIFAKNIPVTISKGSGALQLISKDNTTNVPGNRFYQGTFPIVIVNVDELIPKENARFDPEFWGIYTSTAGIRYAARKLFELEVQVNVGKTD